MNTSWIIACVAPWAISPHPNFSETEVEPARVLALVTERRYPDEADRYPLPTDGWERELVTHAVDSLVDGSQRRAAAALSAASAELSIDLGARVAAALYASVALAELDETEEAVAVASRLDDTLATDSSFPGSSVMARGVLGAQMSMRWLEIGDRGRALESISTTLAILHNYSYVPAGFRVSGGISWNAEQVERDVVDVTVSNLQAIRARAEDFDGDSWTSVVRSRSTWVDSRTRSNALRRDEGFIKEEFERRVEAHAGRITFSRSDVVMEEGYAGLLACELSGDISGSRAAMESLGRLIILRNDSADGFWAREALRLLRQSESKQPLEAGLGRVRSTGPLGALQEAAMRILRRSSFPTRFNEFDALVLSEAADLLDPRDLRAAIRAVVYTQLRVGQRIRSGETDRAWRAISRLFPGSEADSFVAATIQKTVGATDALLPTTASAIERVAEELDWERVADGTRTKLIRWAKSVPAESDMYALAGLIVLGVQGEGARRAQRDAGERAAELLDRDHSITVPEVELSSEEMLDAVVELRREAVGRSISIGSYDTLALAAAFAIKFDRQALLTQVVEALTDEAVEPQLKARALVTLSGSANKISPEVRSVLKRSWDIVSKPGRSEFFQRTEREGYFTDALRAGVALSILPRHDAAEALLRLSASADASTVAEAARILPLVATAYDQAEWAIALLLQLSHHRDPEVSALAGRGLVETSGVRSSLVKPTRDRVIELLAAEGIRRPLYGLHGFQKLSLSTAAALDPSMKRRVSRLSRSHMSRIVRGAANEVIRLDNAKRRSIRADSP